MRIRNVLVITASVVASAFWPPAFGGEYAPTDPDEWNFIITPYFWLLNQSGEVTIQGGTTDIETDLIENMRAFDIGGQFYAEARKGRWGVFTDTTYARSSTDSGNVDVTIEFVQSDFGLLYRLFDRPLAVSRTGAGRALSLDAIVGGRYMSVNNETEIGIQPGFEIEIDESVDWVDPIVGARLMVDLSDRWLLVLRGDIGGFGVNSDRMWTLFGFLGYEMWRNRLLLIGYRAMDVDYEEGEGANRFEYDVLSHGPLLGFIFRF